MACLVAPPWGKGNLRHGDVTRALGLSFSKRQAWASRWSACSHYNIPLVHADASKQLLDVLAGTIDPENSAR
jgi:hypothetical protein